MKEVKNSKSLSENLNGRTRAEDVYRWEKNMRTVLREAGYVVDWIHLAHDRDQWLSYRNTVMSLRVPQTAGNFLSK
jgi:hypothetical protein